MSAMKELIEKYHLPKNTTGVQVSNCLGITAYVRRVIRGYFKDCKVMYRGKDIYITVPSAGVGMRQFDGEDWKDVDIRDKEGNISMDATGRKNGRGAYICPDVKCLEKAMKSKGLERTLKAKVPEEVYEQLKAELGEING